MTDPTPDQLTGNAAAATLATISRLLDDSRILRSQLTTLADCMRQSSPDTAIPEWLVAANAAPGDILRETQEALLELAQALPAPAADEADPGDRESSD